MTENAANTIGTSTAQYLLLGNAALIENLLAERRIAHVVDSFPPAPHPIGGAGVIMQMVAEESNRMGAASFIIVDRFAKNFAGANSWIRDGLSVHTVPIVRSYPQKVAPMGRTSRRHFLANLRVGNIYRRLRPDVLHFHIHPNGLLRFAYALKSRFHLPVVVTTQGLDWVVYNYRHYSDVPFRPYWKESVEAVDYWIPCGPKDEDGLKQWGIPVKKIVPIYNGVDVPDVLPSRSDDRDVQAFEIIYVGRMIEKKGIFDLARAFVKACHTEENTRELTLRFVGAMEPDVRRQLAEILENCKPPHQYIFDGEMPQSQVMRLLRRADLFCYPTKCMEGQPVAPLEAAAQGCPLLISDIPSHLAVFEETKHALYFRAGDTESLGTALRQALREHNSRQFFRLNAFNLIKEKFNKDIMLRQYMQFYAMLFGSSQSEILD